MALGSSSLILVLTNIWNSTLLFLPNLVYAVILLIIGLILGKVIGRIVKEILLKARVDYYLTETDRPAISITNIFTVITRWWIYLLFITQAVNVLNLPILVVWVGYIIGFIPKIVGAALIMVAGYILGDYIKNQMKKIRKEVYADIVGKSLFFFIIYVSISMALPILGVSASLVNNVLLVIIGSVGIGIALAIGLGAKEAVSELSKKYVKKIKV